MVETPYGNLWLYIDEKESVQVLGFYKGDDIDFAIKRYEMTMNPATWSSRPNERQKRQDYIAFTSSLTDFGIHVVSKELQPEMIKILKNLGCDNRIKFYDGKSQSDRMIDIMP